MNPPNISVVIINYNGGAFLQDAVNSLVSQTYKDFELIIFDNASTDGSLSTLDLTGIPAARIVPNKVNVGFAAGNNRAAEQAKGKWLVLLNPDTIANPDWLEKLIEAARIHPDCKSFTSAQLALHNEEIMDGAGDAYLAFGFPWRGGFGHSAKTLPETGWCFSACGAAAMYDLDLFRGLNGFDERFFCYCEDVDLGFRLQLAGNDCLFVSDAIIRHAGSGISGRASAFSTYYGTRNRVWTYAKNTPPALLIATLPVHILMTLLLCGRYSFTARFRPMICGVVDGISGLPTVWRKSPWKPSIRNLPLAKLAGRMSWNPFRFAFRKAHVRHIDDQ